EVRAAGWERGADKEIVQIPGVGVYLPAQTKAHGEVGTYFPIVLDECPVIQKHRAEVRAGGFAGLGVEANVTFREGIVAGEVEHVVEAIHDARVCIVEQGSGTRTSAAALYDAADLERVAAAIHTQHVLPVLVVLNEDRVGESGAV